MDVELWIWRADYKLHKDFQLSGGLVPLHPANTTPSPCPVLFKDQLY